MSKDFAQRDGVALLDLELRTSNTRTVPVLGRSVILDRADITEVSHGISKARFTVVSSSVDYVDKLLREAQSGHTPRVRWRTGIGFPAGETEWLPWQEHIIKNSVSGMEGLGVSTGYTTIIDTADLLWDIDRINRVRAHKGKLSDIVKKIAESYKLPYVVEPTKNEGIYYQSYSSDYEFIYSRLVPRALNEKNRGNYKLFFKDGALHFHTLDYQASLKDYVYFYSPGSTLTVQDHAQDMIDAGSAGVRVVYIDPYTGISGTEISKPENTLRLSQAAPDVSKLKGAERNIMVTVGTNRTVDQLGIASNTYEAAKAEIYTLNLTVPRTLFFRASDICRVTIQPGSPVVPPSSGTYHVSKVKHVIEKTSIVSEIALHRGEFMTKEKNHGDLIKAGEAIAQSRRPAPGQDPNFKAVASSAITKGSQNKEARTVVLATQNPDKPVA